MFSLSATSTAAVVRAPRTAQPARRSRCAVATKAAMNADTVQAMGDRVLVLADAAPAASARATADAKPRVESDGAREKTTSRADLIFSDEKKKERVRSRDEGSRASHISLRNPKCSTYFLRRADRQLVARDWRARSFLFYIKIWISESRTDIFMRLIARTAF